MTIYSTAICDKLLEQEINHVLYGISHVQIGYSKHQRQTFTQPYPLILDRFWVTPYKWSKYKVRPYCLLLTSHFMFWTYQSFKKISVGKLLGGGGGRGAHRVAAAHDLLMLVCLYMYCHLLMLVYLYMYM